MRREYVALLRAIAHVAMQPFRDAMEELGFTDVESYGMSGNLLFNASDRDLGLLERRIGERFRTRAVVRTRSEMARIVARYPFGGDSGASVMFLAEAPAPARRREFQELDFEPPGPVLTGRSLFFVHPARLRGRRGPLDFERALDVEGTARSARVVSQLLAQMSGAAAGITRGDGRTARIPSGRAAARGRERR